MSSSSLLPLRLLLVDDDSEDVTVFHRHLLRGMEGRSCHLTVARAFDEAWGMLNGEAFDLVFLDYRLGERTGLELLEEMQRGGVRTPVVFLTGFGDEETAVSLMKSGAVDYLTKARLNPESLRRSLRYALELEASEARRRESELALGVKGIYLDNILRSATDLGIVASDRDFYVQYYNPMAEVLLGIPRERAIGRSARELHLEAGLEDARFDALIEEARQRGEHLFEARRVQAEETRYLEGRVSPIVDAQGRLAGYCLTIRDVTEKRRMTHSLEQALGEAEEANRAKGDFLAVMSHEIRTPLNAILGMAELALEEVRDEPVRRKLKTIYASGEGLLAIINDILDFSKIEAGKVELEPVDFVLPQLLEEAVRMFEEPARRKGTPLELQVARGTPRRVRGDPFRLRQIVVNLLSNAVKFTEKGRITVTLEPAPQSGQPWRTRITVRDGGIGIAADRLETLFQPFTQAEKSTTRRFGGAGLGLSICRRLAELMGGAVHARSTLGQGSVFTLEIPFDPPHHGLVEPSLHGLGLPPGAPAAANLEEDPPLPRDLRLLVVEDDPVNREVVQGMLRRVGVQPELAANGQEALERLTREPFDLVLLDCQMPEMDGFEVCRRFRAWEAETSAPRRTPVIALTAYALKDDREKCLAAGMDDYLAKPVKGTTLRAAIHRWLQPAEPTPMEPTRKNPAVDLNELAGLQQELGEDFPMVVEAFLSLLPGRLEEFQQAAALGDGERMKRAAHTLKGGARQFGAHDLGEMCYQLEMMGRSGRVDGADFMVEALVEEALCVEKALRALMASSSHADAGAGMSLGE
ncbi:MAG: response regulator [Magnetococcales bacterium]|nr:response regulator [Magnetococcales bacterium]